MTEEQKTILQQEQRILRAMRKTLASVVKDGTPRPGTSGFLSDETIEQIKDCFAMISAREREVAATLGYNESVPVYPDQQRATQNIQVSPKKTGNNTH